MHFVVLKENLMKALSVVGRSISVKPQLPILSYVLIQAKETQLTIHATNLEIGTKFILPAKVEKDGEIAVPGKLLIEFISSLAADKVECIVKDSILIVTAKHTKASFATITAADFPPFPHVPDEQKTLPLTVLKDSVARVGFASSTDETRPVLTGIRVRLNQKELSLAATDGYRMSLERVVLPKPFEEYQTILPARTFTEVVRIAAEMKAEEVGFTMLAGKNQVVFTLPQVQIFSRLIDGEFPNIEKIIPATCKTKVVVDKEGLLQSVKTASLFARGAANIIKMKIEKEGIRLSANAPQIGDDEDFIDAKVEGEPVEVAFNYRFLLDLLANIPGTEVVFETSGSLTPGLFKPGSPTPPFLHVIMPVRVQN